MNEHENARPNPSSLGGGPDPRRGSGSGEGSASEPSGSPRGTRDRINVVRAQEIRGSEIERQSHVAAGPRAHRGAPPGPAGSPAVGQLGPAMLRMDAVGAAKYEELYAASRSVAADGTVRFDERRYGEALAAAGVDPLTQQELQRLGREAAAAGRANLFGAKPR